MTSEDRARRFLGDSDALDAELASYALDGLAEDERFTLERELATSSDLRAQLEAHRSTVALLSSVVEPVQPSAALRSGLLASIAGTAQLPASGRGDDDAAVTAHPVASPDGAATPAEHRARARWFVRTAITLASVAAAACLVLAGVAIGGGVGSTVPAAPEAAPTTAASDDSVALADILAADDATSATSELSGGATATVYASASLKRSAIVWKHLPALPKSKTYEAWYITTTAVPAGTFEADGDTAYEVLDGDMPAKASIGITVEKAGGATKPNLDTLLGTVSTA